MPGNLCIHCLDQALDMFSLLRIRPLKYWASLLLLPGPPLAWKILKLSYQVFDLKSLLSKLLALVTSDWSQA